MLLNTGSIATCWGRNSLMWGPKWEAHKLRLFGCYIASHNPKLGRICVHMRHTSYAAMKSSPDSALREVVFPSSTLKAELGMVEVLCGI